MSSIPRSCGTIGLLLWSSALALPGCAEPGDAGLITESTGDSGTQETDTDSSAPDDEVEVVPGAAILFSPEHAVVDEPFEVRLSTGLTDAELVYTLDASDPRTSDTAQSFTSTGPIPVDTTTVVRVVAWRDGGPVGQVATRTWVFPADVAQQERPPGWPEAWFEDYGRAGYNTPLYGLSEDVLATEAAAVEAALWELPTVSLVVAAEDLWGSDGIYDHPMEDGVAWERAGALELLPHAGAEDFAVGAGVRIHGGASRSPETSPKKSFRLLFKEQYGPASLDHDLFVGSEVSRFDTLVLRARYNQSWIHWDPTQRSRSQYLRDQFSRDSLLATGGIAPHGRPVHLYLDGLYWGVYNLGERPDAHFMVSWYGGEDTDWDVINVGEAVDGTDADWLDLVRLARGGLTDTSAYERFSERLDVPAFMDYMLVNIWLGNDDWPHNNWYASHDHTNDGPWRFFMWDAEHVLKELGTDRTAVNDTSSAGELFAALCQNPDFVEAFSARAEELLADDGPLGAEAAIARYDALAAERQDAVVAESARWGSYRRDVYCYSSGPCPLYTVDEFWWTEHDRLRDEYLPQRTAVVRAQLAARGLPPATD